MKKVILTGLLAILSDFMCAMNPQPDTSIERQGGSLTTIRTVDPRNIGSLPLSQVNVDSFRTIIVNAINDALSAGKITKEEATALKRAAIPAAR